MEIKKMVLVEHSAEQMYQLVYNIRNYPNFLPWCSKTEILEENPDNSVIAQVYIDYLLLKQSFTTKNNHIENQEIHMALVEGPFKKLDGYWHFKEIGSLGCQINFTLDYEFANHLISKVIGPVFQIISTTLVDAFIKEADRKYA